jgi:hypothetical protein
MLHLSITIGWPGDARIRSVTIRECIEGTPLTRDQGWLSMSDKAGQALMHHDQLAHASAPTILADFR